MSRGGSEESQRDTQRRRETYCRSHWPAVWHRSQRSTHEEVFEYLMQEEGRPREKDKREGRKEGSTELVRREKDKSRQEVEEQEMSKQ